MGQLFLPKGFQKTKTLLRLLYKEKEEKGFYSNDH
jgi:hypothetical protein